MSQNNGDDEEVQQPTDNLSPGLEAAKELPAVKSGEASDGSTCTDERTGDRHEGELANSPQGRLSAGHTDGFTIHGQNQAIGPPGGADAEQNGGAGTSETTTVIPQSADRMAAGGTVKSPESESDTEVKARLRSQQAASGKSLYLQLDAKGQPQKLSTQILFDPKTDTSGTNIDEVLPTDSASQLGGTRIRSTSTNSSVATTVAKTQAEAYKKQRDLSRQKLKECQQQLKQLQDENSQRIRQLQEENDQKLRRLSDQNEQLQDQLEKAQDAQLESDRQLAARNVQLEGDLTDAEAEIARVQAAVQVAETEASVAKSRCAQIEKELQQSQGEVETAQRRLATLQQQTPPNELVEKCRNANAVAEALKEEIKVLKQNCEASQQESRRLRTQLSGQETRRLQAEKQKESELAEGLESSRRANQGIQWREERIHDLQEENSELTEKLQQTQERLGAYSEEAVDLQNKFDPESPPIDNKVLSYVTNKHLWSSRIQATTQPTGYVAQPSEMPSSRQPPQQPDPTGGPRPLNAGATPFQPVAGTSYSTYDPTTVGHSNVRFGETSRTGLLSSTNARTTPATAGRLKIDIPPLEKLDVTRGQASRTQFNKWKRKLKMFFELSGHEETLWPKFVPWYLQGYAEEQVMTFLETPEGREATFEDVMVHIERTLLHKPNAAVTMIEMRQLVYDKRKYTLNEFLQKLMEKQTELKKGEPLDDKDMELVKMDFLYKLPQTYQDFITWRDGWEEADVYDFVNWADHFENRQETREYVMRSDEMRTDSKRAIGFSQEERAFEAEGDFRGHRPTGRYPPRPRPRDRKKNFPVSKLDRGRKAAGAHRQDGDRTQSTDFRTPYSGRTVTCYNCGGVGHYARDCRNPKSPRDQSRTNEVKVDQQTVYTNQVSDEPVTIYQLFDEDQLPLVRGAIDIDTIDVSIEEEPDESGSQVENLVLNHSFETSDFVSADGLLSIFDLEGDSVQIDEIQVEELQKTCIPTVNPMECSVSFGEIVKISGVGEMAVDSQIYDDSMAPERYNPNPATAEVDQLLSQGSGSHPFHHFLDFHDVTPLLAQGDKSCPIQYFLGFHDDVARLDNNDCRIERIDAFSLVDSENFQRLILKMPNKKRKRDESKRRSEKRSSKNGHKSDDSQSRRLSGASQVTREYRSTDRSEHHQRKADSERGAPTHTRSWDYYPREGRHRDTSTSKTRDTPQYTGAQSAIFTAEVTAQAATIAASLSDV